MMNDEVTLGLLGQHCTYCNITVNTRKNKIGFILIVLYI